MKARLPCVLILTLCAAASAHAQTAQPLPPQVTMGADIKLLRFDWEPVPGAAFYQLKFRARSNAAYQLLGERIPASVTHTEHAIPVHLQDWSGMRFIVTACNRAGCTNSAALNPRPLMLDTIGYLKASNAEADDHFGRAVALSDDGYTLAVSAWLESSDATGVNGDQANNRSLYSGAVYVFRRRGNSWQQEAYLKPAVNLGQQYFGSDVQQAWRAMALSADGSVLAVSASFETVDGLGAAGAVYIFQRVQNAWRFVTTFREPTPRENSWFGTSPDMSDDGRTLKVMAVGPPDEFGHTESRTYVFVRPANTWRRSVVLAPPFPGDTCLSTRLSGDGQTLVWSCGIRVDEGRIVTMKRAGDTWVPASVFATNFLHLRQPIALNSDASVMAIDETGTPFVVGLYRWVSGQWVRETGFPSPVTEPFDQSGFGWDLALSGDGNLLGIGAPYALERGPGISPITMPGPATLGAVYLYERNPGTGSWALRNVVKSANPGFRDQFGTSIGLSASGRTLAVGAPGENSNARGIGGDRVNESAPNAGAAYLY